MIIERLSRTPIRVLTVAIAAALIAGCGSDKDSNQSKQPASKPTQSSGRNNAPAKGDMSAEEVAKEARGKVKCPAKTKLPKRGANAPVDDVVGVRIGMSYEEAANAVMCTHELLIVGEAGNRGFRIETYGTKLRQGLVASYAKPRVTQHKTSRDYMREWQEQSIARASNRATKREPGARWFVATMGLPAQEQVISVYREELYEPERAPTVDSVREALLKKYGTPTLLQDHGTGVSLRWAYDPRGRLITETSPLFHTCKGAPHIDAGTQTSPDCGIVTEAVIRRAQTNPGIAADLMVGVTDLGKGYELVTETEQALLRAEEQRRQKQLQDAQKDAVAPTL
jgi:YD repeat-containing protein